jgi:hypothetical protein
VCGSPGPVPMNQVMRLGLDSTRVRGANWAFLTGGVTDCAWTCRFGLGRVPSKFFKNLRNSFPGCKPDPWATRFFHGLGFELA